MKAAIKWTIPPIVLAALFVAAILAPLSGCGASARERVIRATFVTINSARDGFTTFDAQHQQQIIDDAKTLDEGKAALVAYRHNRETVLVILVDAYLALSTAVLADDPKSLAILLEVADHLKQAIDDIKKAKAP
jgi:hypothetical protein